MNIINSLYDRHYRYLYTFEYYAYMLEKGYGILQSGKLDSQRNTIELRALQLALEYNLHAMSEGQAA